METHFSELNSGAAGAAVLDPPATKVRRRRETHSVLVIEDDSDLRNGWGLLLRKAGYCVLGARDGHQGLLMIAEEQPSLILLDLGLPGLHGIEILRRLKEEQNETPVAVVTASSSRKMTLEAIQLGAKAVLEKPVHPVQVIRTLKEILPKG